MKKTCFLLLLLSLSSCGEEAPQYTKSVEDGSSDEVDNNSETSDSILPAGYDLVKSEAYFENIIVPVFEECGSCHRELVAPLFLTENNSDSHNVFASDLIDFDDFENSSAYTKLFQDHNCGDFCIEMANDLLDVLNSWEGEALAD